MSGLIQPFHQQIGTAIGKRPSMPDKTEKILS
jgi:hypothetical protein